MNISRDQVREQMRRVVERGWWPFIEGAIDTYFPQGPFDEYDLFGIGSRETNWDPRYLSEPGDNGNGFGLLQVDRRTAPQWVASGAWKDARRGIMKGASILRAKYDQAYDLQGKAIVAKTRAGESFSVTAKRLTPAELKRVAVASYNSGLWALYHVSKGRHPDRGTTGGDYGTDVLERAATARTWKTEKTKPCPKCHGSGRVKA